jgi:hypothetical protein
MKAIIINLERHPGDGITARFIKSRYARLSLFDSTLYTETGILKGTSAIQGQLTEKNHGDVNAGLTGLFNSVGSFRGDGYDLISANLER